MVGGGRVRNVLVQKCTWIVSLCVVWVWVWVVGRLSVDVVVVVVHTFLHHLIMGREESFGEVACLLVGVLVLFCIALGCGGDVLVFVKLFVALMLQGDVGFVGCTRSVRGGSMMACLLCVVFQLGIQR